MRKMKRMVSLLFALILTLGLITGCGGKSSGKEEQKNPWDPNNLVSAGVDDKYGACYQVFIYSFCDSNGDGIGDFNGLTSKLDYIKDLGFDSIWLLPFHESPSYHKYDVKDYYSIDKQYGTMEDFDNFMAACKEKNIDVYMDYVINHSSSQHEWFKKAAEYIRSLGEGEEIDYSVCPEAEYYNFSKKKDAGYGKLPGTKDWYYECQFVAEMPDLNLECKAVRKEIEDNVKFWCEKGIKGFRLDAALHYVEGDTKSSVEILKWFKDYVYSIDPENYIVAEVWSDASTILDFYEAGIDSYFNFPFAAGEGAFAVTVNRAGNGDGGAKLSKYVVSNYNDVKSRHENAIDAMFLANHDIGRAAGFLHHSADTIKYGAALSILSPGKAYVYYGDELGMAGSGIDENKRAPMLWSTDAKAEGMTKGPAAMQPQNHKFPALEVQKDDSSSIYNYYKKALLIRNAYPSIARGVPAVMEEVVNANGNLYATSRTTDTETTYVIINNNEAPTTVKVSKSTYKYSGIAADLNIGEEASVLDGEELTIPAYGCVVLK